MQRIWITTFLAVMVLPFVCGPGRTQATTDDGAATSEESSKQKAQAAEIEKWIKQLGAADFEQREQATVELWRLGPLAEPALQAAQESADREIAFRARTILERFRLGIFADTDPDQIRLIRRYTSSTDRDKQNLIRQMIGEGRVDEIIFLLARESNENLREQLSQYVAASLDQLVPRLQADGKATLAEQALIQFSITPTSQFLLASYGYSQGPEKHAALLEAATNAWQDEDPMRLARQRLLGNLVAGEIDAALQQLPALPDQVEARAWINSIYLAEGRFAELLTHVTEGKNADEFDIATMGWLPQDLVLATWTARVTDNTPWQNALEPVLADWIKTEKMPLNQRIKLNLLTDRVTPSIEEAESVDKLLAFALMCYRDQFQVAFEHFGIGKTSDDRAKWYESLASELKELEEKQKNQRQQLTTDEQKLRMAIEGAGWLASVGQRDEAQAYFDQIFQAIPNRLASSRMYQYRILDLEFRNQFNQSFCEHVIAIMGKARFDQAFGQINSVDRDGYTFWWWALEAEAPEPAERLALIRNLLLDPYDKPIAAEQLESWLEVAETYYGSGQQNTAQVSSPSVVLANTCFKHRLNEKALAYLVSAIDEGLREGNQKSNADALESAQRLSEWHADRKEWTESERAASQWLELLGGANNTEDGAEATVNWGHIHRIKCLRELNRDDEAQTILNSLLATNYSINQLSTLARLLDDEAMSADSQALWKRMCYQPGKDFRPFAAYSYPALIGLANVVLDDPTQGNPSWVESFLGYMLADNNDWYLRGSINSMHPVVALLNFREQINQAYAHQSLATGDTSQAVRHLERALTARPGNVDNVVAFVEELEAANAGEELDALFSISRQLHLDVLDAFPNSAMHHNNLAWLCACAKKRLDEALEHSQRATELRPSEDTYWDTLAEVYFQQGNLEKALELARKCVSMDPLYPHYQIQQKKYEAALNKP